MRAVRVVFLVGLSVGVVCAEEPKKPVPKFKLDKAVTFVTEPLDDDGYIDYEAALNKLMKGKATPDTNAVVLLLKCFGPKPEGAELKPDFYKALGVDPPPAEGDYLVPAGTLLGDEYRGENADEFNKLEARIRQQPWTAKDSPKHAEYLAVNAKPLAVAVEATKRPDYYHPTVSRKPDGSRGLLIGALLPTVQKTREIASLLSFRVTFRLGEGKVEEAFTDVLAIHRLGRLLGKGGTLIELLVAVAMQGIAHGSEQAIFEHGKVTAKQALAYQAELMKLPPMPTVADKLRQTERFILLDVIQTGHRDGFESLDDIANHRSDRPKKTKEEIEAQASKLDFEVILRLCNTWYDRCADAAAKPDYLDRKKATDTIENEIRAMSREAREKSTPLYQFFLRAEPPEKQRAIVSERIGKTYVGLMLPAFNKVNEASARGEQMLRNALVVAALAAYRADTGAYPDKLAVLTPKYLAKVPSDFFTNKDVIYRKTEAGYLLYSAGPNGKDDGGALTTDEPRGDDVGVRMPRQK